MFNVEVMLSILTDFIIQELFNKLENLFIESKIEQKHGILVMLQCCSISCFLGLNIT